LKVKLIKILLIIIIQILKNFILKIDSASSFGKILFKKRPKKNPEEELAEATSSENTVKKSEIDLIFNLDKEGKEQEKTEEDEAAQATEAGSEKRKKILLDDEEPEKDKKYGLQQPVVKKRFIDGPTSKVETFSAKK
jgi:hypothetical protein